VTALIDVVIVTARGARDHLHACLSSLERHPPAAGQLAVHVVDNASGDGTVEMVRRDFPGVELTELGRNAGYAIANNVVLRRSSAPFSLLLNPDTAVGEGVLDRLVAVMRERPTVGLAGPRLEKPDGTLDHAAKWTFDPSPGALALGALAHFTRVGRRGGFGGRLSRYRATGVPERGTGTVDALSGACMLARREAIAQVGLLDEGYWLYIEDLDWCRRFRLAGWDVWYEGGVNVLHVKGTATKGARRHRSPRANLAFHRGMGRFYRRFYAGRRPLLDAAVYAGIGIKLAVSTARGAMYRRTAS
jgi:GT2 family glycosyltransferase